MFECKLCGNVNYKYKKKFTKKIGCDPALFKIVQCKKCKLISMFPTPTDNDLKWIYGNYAEAGDREYVEKLRMQKIYPEKLKKIESYVTEDKELLDIGAGLGGFCKVAQDLGFKTTGIEYSKEQVSFAQKNFNVNLINSTVETFFEKNDTLFDIIHLHHVMEHLQNPLVTLSNIKNILKKEGIIIVEVPNQFFQISKKNLQIYFGLKKQHKPYNPYHHIHFFSPQTIKKLFERSGYQVLELNEPTRDGSVKKIINVINASLGVGVSNIIEVIATKKG